MKLLKRYISIFYLFALFAGTLFFIPAIFVNQFITAPALWMQGAIALGIVGYVLLSKKRQIYLPSKHYMLLIVAWAIYHIWQNKGNIDNVITILACIAGFFLFFTVWTNFKNKKIIFLTLGFLSIPLSLWGLLQTVHLLPSYNGSFTLTGPFDNPAGISASLAVLLPFSLYGCRFTDKKLRILSIIATCLITTVIIFSQARAAVLAMIVIYCLFFVYILKERDFKFRPLHYSFIALGCIIILVGLIFVKKDSASGRLLIWQCSAELISQKPLLGYGGNGFTANYMNTQASFFTRHPESKHVMLADNIRHPFNEFLKWSVNYGILGLCLTLLLIIVPLQASWKSSSPELFFIRLSFLSICFCALFSYPFNYPFIRLMVLVLVAFLVAADNEEIIKTRNGYCARATSALLSFGILIVTAYQGFYESEWHKIAHKSLKGETEQMLPRYEMLCVHLGYKDLFLYNYAAELNVVSKYAESKKVALECEKLWADYDLQMLMADNWLNMGCYIEAEKCLKLASAMCPVKFMPLYQLTELYLKTDRKHDARELAKKILHKKVKISSPVINTIKMKMRNVLNETDSIDCSTQIDNMNPTTISSWQDCFLDQRTPRALLPT